MTDMREDERERIGRLANEICGCSTLEQHRRDIALIEAEIDRRVAEERAKLLERLRDIKEAWDWWQVDTYDRCASVVEESITAAIAQFEKENSHEQG